MKTRFTLLVCFAALILPAKLWAGLALVGKSEVVIKLDDPTPYSYTVKTTGGSPALKYTWQNTASSTFPNDSTIIYTPKKLGYDTIYCTVSDQTNATIKKTIVFYNTDICSPSIYFDNYTAIIGDTITVSLKINNITAQCGYTNFQAHIVYDSTMLDYVDATMKNSVMPSGDLLYEELTKDSLSFGFTPSWDDIDAVLSGNGTMVDFRFITKKIGTSKLFIDEPLLIGHLVTSVTNGSVTILTKPTLQIKPDTAFVNDTLTTYIAVSNLSSSRSYTNFESSILFDTTALRFIDASMKNTVMPDADLLAMMNDTNSVYVGFSPYLEKPNLSFKTNGNLVQVRFLGKKAGRFRLTLKIPLLEGSLLDTTSAVCVVEKRSIACNPSIYSEDYSAIVGDTVTVSLKINNITAQCGYNNFICFVNYDSTMLRYVDATMKNSVMPDAYFLCEERTKDSLSFSFMPSWDTHTESVLQENGTMVDFRFVTKKIGTSKLLISDPYINGDLVTSITNGTVTILAKPEISMQAAATCQNDTIRLQLSAKNLFGNALMSSLTAAIQFPASVTYQSHSLANSIMVNHHVSITNTQAGEINLELNPSTITSPEEQATDGTLITLLFVAKDSGVVTFSSDNIQIKNLSLNKSINLKAAYPVVVNDAPNVEIKSTKICYNPNFQFYPFHLQAQIYTLWTLPDGSTKETGRLFTTQEGLYTIMQRNDAGCKSSDTALLSFIYPNGNAQFSVTESDTVQARYLFSAEAESGIQWKLPDNSTNNQQQFTQQFETALSGDVCLTAVGTNQCPLTKCVNFTFKVKPTLYSINGTVTDKSNQNVAATVVAYYLRGSEYVALDSAVALANGTFVVNNLPKGKYTLGARPTNTDLYKTTYFYDASNITTAESFSIIGNGTSFDIKMLSATTALNAESNESKLSITVGQNNRISIDKRNAAIDKLMLITANGQVIDQISPIQNHIEFTVQNINTGMYMIVALANNNVVTVQKIILP